VIVSIEAMPPLDMVWNDEYVSMLTPEAVVRWYNGESLESNRAMAELVKLATVCDLGPEVDLEALLTDFRAYIRRRGDRATLLHEMALPFCVDRSRTQRYTLPASLDTRHHKAVAKLLGREN